MRPIHLSRLRIPGGDLDDVAHLHAEWALGLLRFASLRAERLAAGVPADTGIEDLVETGGQWTFKFTLPERDDITRTSAIRVSTQGTEVVVEHLVTRDGPPSSIVVPTASPPDVVPWMLANIPNIEPAGLRNLASQTIDEFDVPSFVDDILSPERNVPFIIAAVENASREALIDAAELGRRLAGMAKVYQLASVRTSYRLREELMNRDIPEKFGCYNGGVRILRPAIQPHDNPYDHLLLLPVRLLGLLAKSRSEQVAGIFCELIAEGEDPRRWLRELEPQRAPGPAPATRPSSRVGTHGRTRGSDDALVGKLGSLPGLATPAPAPAAAQRPAPSLAAADSSSRSTSRPESMELGAAESIDASQSGSRPRLVEQASDENTASELAPVDSEVQAARPTSSSAPTISTWSVLADDMHAALQLAAEQEREFHALHQELADVRKLLRRAQQERDEFAGPPTSAPDALARAEALYPDKLIVLKTARVSAEDSGYRDPARVLFVLSLLANCDANTFGEVLSKALGAGARWKPRDSPETVAKFGKDRTFPDSTKKPKLFTRHVTLGHGVNAKKCLQIYYDVLGDGRIEIAWCGEHRPTVSEDT